MKVWLFPASIFLGMALLAGCTIVTPVRSELRTELTEQISIAQIRKSPDAFKGRRVMWGGRIVKTRNKKEGTWIEVLHLPLDQSDRPVDSDMSEGRFLALNPAYLDSMIYGEGRKVTIVGEILGLRPVQLDEIRYIYPFLKIRKIHLWPEEGPEIRIYHDYPPHIFHRPCRRYWWYSY